MAERGGKRRGAGRKPAQAAAKDVNYNARISTQTLERLKAEAKASGDSVAALAGYLIEQGLDHRLNERQKKENSPGSRALGYIVAHLSRLISEVYISADQRSIPWRDDPFMFEALKLSIEKFMRVIRPRGEMVAPVDRTPSLKEMSLFGPLESAEARANWAAILTVRALLTAEHKEVRLPEGVSARQARFIQDTEYTLANARRDLGYEKFELTDLMNEEDEK
jgi:hypothetical protein